MKKGTMQNNKLQKYVAIADFIADISGPRYEVVLHDVSQPDASVIHIRNNHISGRSQGSPMTDLALEILMNQEYKVKDYITNYRGRGVDNKIFISSTYFIKEDDELIGMICINNDIQDVKNMQTAFNMLMERFNYSDSNGQTREEVIEPHVASTVKSIINKEISNSIVEPMKMSLDERIHFVKSLEEKGVFLLKGAVQEIATYLKTSEATIYRYLNK